MPGVSQPVFMKTGMHEHIVILISNKLNCFCADKVRRARELFDQSSDAVATYKERRQQSPAKGPSISKPWSA